MAINKSVAAIVVAFITGLSPMGVIFTQNMMEQRKMEAGIIDTSVLLNHSLFTHADTWVDLIIPGLQVSETAREFLTIKFVAFQEALEDLVKNNDFANFNLWHQQVVDILVQSIEDNVYSIIHTTQNSKMYAILTAYDAALGATIGDVEKTLEMSNR